MPIFQTLRNIKLSADFTTGVQYTLDNSRSNHAIKHVLRVFVVLR